MAIILNRRRKCPKCGYEHWAGATEPEPILCPECEEPNR